MMAGLPRSTDAFGRMRDFTGGYDVHTMIGVHHLDRAVGTALRRARDAAGLSLKDVERLTEGRFKPSTVAGYERGERSISVSRFLSLARFYSTHPDEILSDALSLIRHGDMEVVVVLPGDVAETVNAATRTSFDEVD